MNALLTALRYSSAVPGANTGIEKHAPTRDYHVMDTTVCTTMILVVASAALGALSPQASEMMALLLLPLIGATVVTGGAIMLNPDVEKRKITMGRGLIGFLLGIPGPWAFTALLKYWSLDGLEAFFRLPPLLVLTGAAFCFVAYVLSRPFFAQAYERADVIARHNMKQIERMSGMHDKPEE